MRHQFRRLTPLVVPVLASCLLFSSSSLPASSGKDEIRVSLVGHDRQGRPTQLELIGGAYEVDVYGATAMVALTQEFRGTDAEISAGYLWTAPQGHLPEHLLLETGGAVRPLSMQVKGMVWGTCRGKIG